MMLRILMIAAAVLSLSMCGCSKKEPVVTPEGGAAVSPLPVTEENLDTELDKLEAEIQADIAAEE